MRRQGFTLAEVLITLGIIGVVAAMTIPTLISNTNGAQFKSAYKKALSSLNQAVLMNVALEDYSLSNLAKDTAGDGSVPKTLSKILTERMQAATEITDEYYDETDGAGASITIEGTTEIKCTGDETDGDCKDAAAGTKVTVNISETFSAENSFVYAFADGTTFGYLQNTEKCNNKGTDKCIAFIDVNGKTAPNELTKCDDADAETCTVSAASVNDIFPVFLHGQTVEPATAAAKAVLFGK